MTALGRVLQDFRAGKPTFAQSGGACGQEADAASG